VIGRIDVHSHLIPGVDDGCQTVEEAVECARVLVEHGYTHCCVTPHIWPSLPKNTVANIPVWANQLQHALEAENIPLRLIPGGEINLSDDTLARLSREELVTYGMAGRHVLIDMWASELPQYFEEAVQKLADFGLTVVLAHPERMYAVQQNPGLSEEFRRLGVLLQGNLQCLSDPPRSATRRVAEQYLAQGEYFMLGSDTHNPQSLDVRMRGLARAIELVGPETAWKLTRDHPAKLIPEEWLR
jgi:protein-tyrosine phosphatase